MVREDQGQREKKNIDLFHFKFVITYFKWVLALPNSSNSQFTLLDDCITPLLSLLTFNIFSLSSVSANDFLSCFTWKTSQPEENFHRCHLQRCLPPMFHLPSYYLAANQGHILCLLLKAKPPVTVWSCYCIISFPLST